MSSCAAGGGMLRSSRGGDSLAPFLRRAAAGAASRQRRRLQAARPRRPDCLVPAAAPARPLRPAARGHRPSHQAVDDHLDRCAASADRAANRRKAAPRGRRPGPGRSLASAGRRTGRGIPPSGCESAGPGLQNRVPFGKRDRCGPMICSRVWAVIGREHFGQCPWPVRAYSTRR